MGFTEFGSNDPQAVKRWSDAGFRETIGMTSLKGMIGRRETSAIVLKSELNKDPGDEIKFDLLTQDRGNGVNGDTQLEGYEDDLNYEQDVLRINQKRKGVAYKRMSQQRTLHDLRKDGRYSLTEWGAWFLENALFTHLAGVAGDGNESVAGALGVAPLVPGGSDFAGNTVGIDGSNTIDSGHLVDETGNTMTLDMIDDLVAKAKEQNPRVPPLRIGGQDKFVLYLHHYSARSLRQQATAVRSWTAIQEQANVRGKSNPIYSGALGEYNNVIMKESQFVPRVGNVTHNVMVGASAACIAFGNAWETISREPGGGGSEFEIIEQFRDYKNTKGMALAMCMGIKRATFDSKAYGCMVLKTTEAGPS